MASQAGQCGFECPIITAALDTAMGAKDAGWDKKDISLLAAWRTKGDQKISKIVDGMLDVAVLKGLFSLIAV